MNIEQVNVKNARQISFRLQGELASMRKRLMQDVEKQRLAREESERQRRVKKEKVAQILRHNLEQATQGIQNIMSFAQRPEIQEILALKTELSNINRVGESTTLGGLCFYYGGDQSNSAGAQLVEIYLTKDKVCFRHIEAEIDEHTDEIELGSSRKAIEDFLSARDEGEYYATVQGLAVSARPSPFVGQGRHVPSHVLLCRVLVDCARPRRFREYCRRALQSA